MLFLVKKNLKQCLISNYISLNKYGILYETDTNMINDIS